MLHPFGYLAPASRPLLFELLAAHGRQARLLAGGTDLLVGIRSGLVRPDFVIDIKKTEGYSGISWSAAEGLVIRPAVTINELLLDADVRTRFPLLGACAGDLASYQIRNRATVIGNVVNASPCSDMAPALLCLDARALIASTRGRRELPFREFFTGVKRTVLAPDEVLERIVVPAGMAGAVGGYRKLKRINGHDLGIIGVALLKKDGRLRLGISSAAPTPVLVGDLPAATPPAEVAARALASISPISDLRCSREYREFMCGVFIRRLMEELS
jgi:CO/xanthine dehydrogenase FAD-binding subunit